MRLYFCNEWEAPSQSTFSEMTLALLPLFTLLMFLYHFRVSDMWLFYYVPVTRLQCPYLSVRPLLNVVEQAPLIGAVCCITDMFVFYFKTWTFLT